MIKSVITLLLFLLASPFVIAQNPNGGTIIVTKPIPSIFVATIGGTFNGKLSIDQLANCGAIQLTPPSEGQIIGFELTVRTGVGQYQVMKSIDPFFTSRMFSSMAMLPVGSIFFFRKIKVLRPDSTILQSNNVTIMTAKDSIVHSKKIFPALAKFGGITGGYVTKEKLKRYKFLKIISDEEEFIVTSFSVYVTTFKGKKTLLSNTNEVTAKMRSFFAGLIKGTLLTFDNIRAKSARGKKIIVPPLIMLIE